MIRPEQRVENILDFLHSEYDNEDDVSVVVSALCDLMHGWERSRMDFDTCLRYARAQYKQERKTKSNEGYE